ncbi:MAG: hypothetical protein J6B55_07795, partial [Clostridia bacterium]|nr:hypothetical protein [Clostridia bacterium]
MKKQQKIPKIFLTVFLAFFFLFLGSCNSDSSSGESKITTGGENKKMETPASTGSEGLKYQKNDDGSYSVCALGSCTDTNIIIPNVYNEKPVTSIEYYAFYGCKEITHITIPDSV